MEHPSILNEIRPKWRYNRVASMRMVSLKYTIGQGILGNQSLGASEFELQRIRATKITTWILIFLFLNRIDFFRLIFFISD